MIPLAGDEITEKIAKNYLVDFNTAETIKIAASNPDNETVTFNDIMGLEQTVAASEIQAIADDSIANMAKSTADRIIELNGGKSVNAVFVVGGGGKASFDDGLGMFDSMVMGQVHTISGGQITPNMYSINLSLIHI